MVLRLRFVFGILSAALAVPVLAFRLGLDFLAGVLATLAPEPPMIAASGSWAAFTGGGSPLDSALQHGLRHEARTRTRAAHRHT